MDENTQRASIKNWSEDDRPREKLLLKGKGSLSDAELIAILIASGNKDESAVDLSKRILKSVDNNLIELSKLTVNDLKKFKGIGEAKAITIAAAMELGNRRRGAEVMDRKRIITSHDAFEVMQMHIGDPNYEYFFVILLNQAGKIIRTLNISEGGITGTVVDPKKVFKLAIENNATSIILGHNHPSGSVLPSEQDKKLTIKIKEAGKFLEIAVLDHVIIGSEQYYSFADSGEM
ncbi:MAG: DNA repair protein RadC [Bacteroidales bacterium]|nr:DNA repair protein RadC [Bacteroidales bacterium]